MKTAYALSVMKFATAPAATTNKQQTTINKQQRERQH